MQPPAEQELPAGEEHSLPLPVRMLLRLVATVVGVAVALMMLVAMAYAFFGGPLLLMSFLWVLRD